MNDVGSCVAGSVEHSLGMLGNFPVPESSNCTINDVASHGIENSNFCNAGKSRNQVLDNHGK